MSTRKPAKKGKRAKKKGAAKKKVARKVEKKAGEYHLQKAVAERVFKSALKEDTALDGGRVSAEAKILVLLIIEEHVYDVMRRAQKIVKNENKATLSEKSLELAAGICKKSGKASKCDWGYGIKGVPKATLERMMKAPSGKSLKISAGAKELMQKLVCGFVRDLAKASATAVVHARRKTVMSKDLLYGMRTMGLKKIYGGLDEKN